MEGIRYIQGAEVQNLITKFYYKQNHLCFQILLHLGLDNTIPFKEFSDYSEYKKEYAKLLKMKNEDAQIKVVIESVKKRTKITT